MDESIKNILLEKHGKLNFNGLIDLIEKSDITIKNTRLYGACGLATCNCVYLDMEMIDLYGDDRMTFYIILHEIGHFKRINRMGKKWMISLLSILDLTIFKDSIVHEEILADRYSCYIYNVLNKKILSRSMTQQLDKEENKNKYSKAIKSLYGYVNNDEKRYDELVQSFLK